MAAAVEPTGEEQKDVQDRPRHLGVGRLTPFPRHVAGDDTDSAADVDGSDSPAAWDRRRVPGHDRRMGNSAAAGQRRSAILLGALLLVTGTVHFVRPQLFDDLVPEALPGAARGWNLAAGAAELAFGAALLPARTRRRAAGLTALFFVAVFPGNVKMALDARDGSGAEQAVAYARLPLQIPLVIWALRVRRRA